MLNLRSLLWQINSLLAVCTAGVNIIERFVCVTYANIKMVHY